MQNVLGRGLSSEEITDIQRLAESAKTATVRDLLLRVASLSGSGNGIPLLQRIERIRQPRQPRGLA